MFRGILRRASWPTAGLALAFSLLAVTPARAQPVPQAQQAAQGQSTSRTTLGRLFHTPQQRQELDRRRELNIQEVIVVNEGGTVTLNGQVTRSSGKTTTWVNDAPQHDTYRPRDPSTVPVAPSQGESRVPLKVGQSLDRARGTVSDNLDGGSVTVDRPARGGR